MRERQSPERLQTNCQNEAPSERIMTSLAPERIGQVCRVGGSVARTLVASLCRLSLSPMTVSAPIPTPGPFDRSEHPPQD